MKRILTILTAILAISATSSYAQKAMTDKTFDFGEFTSISASSVHKIYLSKGNSNKIEVMCPQRFIDYLDYSVSGETLYLNLKDNKGNRGWSFREDEEIIVKIQMTEINSISLSGASELIPEGSFKTKNLRLKMSGASEMEAPLVIYGTSLNCDLSGSSDCSIRGNFEKATNEISGASELDFRGNIDDLYVEASGAAECQYEGQSEIIKLECSGSAEAELKGRTTEIIIECSGASEVDAEEMIAVNAKASASGASSIKVYGEEKVDLDASMASSIKFYGPARDLRTANKSISRGR